MTRSEALQVAKPILFNTEMVRAIQNGTKTATRRLMKPQPESVVKTLSRDKITPLFSLARFLCSNGEREWVEGIKMPYQEGDILYVRETWFYEGHMHELTAGKPDLPSGRYSFRYIYKASYPDYPVDVGVGANGWCPSIHMPKEAARIFLRVTGVKVERLQDITITGLQEEGILNDGYISQYAAMTTTAFEDFKDLWDSTLKKSDLEKYGWDANPWVWVIEFERLEVTE